jgi:DNA-binding response OmpR family regulator
MTNPPPQPASRIPPRFLIIEDDRAIARMIEEIVRELGYTVSGVAGTIAMARLQIAKRDFDAVLLDIDLQGEYH